MIGLMIWVLGFGSVLSFNVLADVQFLAGTIFDNIDYLTSNIMLPLGGLLIAVFAGWVMCRNSTSDELGDSGAVFKAWRLLARFVAPIGILFVLAQRGRIAVTGCQPGHVRQKTGSMRKVSRSALVPYSAAQMYALVKDVEAYPSFLPWCNDAEVHIRDEDFIEASLELHRGRISKTFRTRNALQENESLGIDLVGGPFQHMSGGWTFQPLG